MRNIKMAGMNGKEPPAMIQRAVIGFLRSYNIEGRVLVGVSGGIDSMVLFDLLCRLPHMVTIECAHCDHGLRPPHESDADWEFVKGYAARRGIKFHGMRYAHGDLSARAREQSRSLEQEARLARYYFFEQVMERHNIRFLALAHHADDQCETVLMRVCQGGSVSGLAGIQPVRTGRFAPKDDTHQHDSVQGRAHDEYAVIRPLLELPRAAIADWAAAHEVPYREDSTNRSHAILRNRVRGTIMPAIAKVFPQYRTGIAYSTRRCTNALSIIEHIQRQEDIWETASPSQSGIYRLTAPRTQFFRLPSAMRIETLLDGIDRLARMRDASHDSRLSPVTRSIPHRFVRAAAAQEREAHTYVLLKGHGVLCAIQGKRVILENILVNSPRMEYTISVVPLFSSHTADETIWIRCASESSDHVRICMKFGVLKPPLILRNGRVGEQVGAPDGERTAAGGVMNWKRRPDWVLEDRQGVVTSWTIETKNRLAASRRGVHILSSFASRSDTEKEYCIKNIS